MTSSLLFRAVGALLVAAAVALPAFGQDLKWGSKAPALSIEEWIKGKEIQSFQPGQIYVVEFWATWCGPCLRSIPHLSEVQRKYEASKVTVLGVASSEDPELKLEDQRKGLVKFVEGKAETMAYTVAFDPDSSMSASWMEPAGQDGIPTCFVVDGTGTIAWIGSPFVLDEPLAKIVAGKWDVKAELAREAAKMELFAKADAAAQAEDWGAAIASLDEAIKLGDDVLREVAGFKYAMHLQKKDFDGAFAFIDKHLQGALKDEGDLLNSIAWGMVDPEQADTMTKKDYEFALRCSARACELVKGKPDEPAMLDTMAALLFAKGDKPKAVEVQTRAVGLMKGKKGVEEFEKRLETYKK